MLCVYDRTCPMSVRHVRRPTCLTPAVVTCVRMLGLRRHYGCRTGRLARRQTGRPAPHTSDLQLAVPTSSRQPAAEASCL
jgi:hypothetical protein